MYYKNELKSWNALWENLKCIEKGNTIQYILCSRPILKKNHVGGTLIYMQFLINRDIYCKNDFSSMKYYFVK